MRRSDGQPPDLSPGRGAGGSVNRLPRRSCYFPLRLAGVWDRALPAAVLEAFDVRPSRSTLDAALAALALVLFFAAMVSSNRDGRGEG